MRHPLSILFFLFTKKISLRFILIKLRDHKFTNAKGIQHQKNKLVKQRKVSTTGITKENGLKYSTKS